MAFTLEENFYEIWHPKTHILSWSICRQTKWEKNFLIFRCIMDIFFSFSFCTNPANNELHFIISAIVNIIKKRKKMKINNISTVNLAERRLLH